MTSSSWELGSLSIFEAAGRLENLTLAARELGMTQPAVSYQIKRLEDAIGVNLFARRARGVELLPEGQILYEAVRAGLNGINEALQQIRSRQRAPGLRITTDYGFATFWLMPRVALFRSKNPTVDVRVTASSMLQPIDQRDSDISILFGDREDFPSNAVAFISEKVFPVCSPKFLEENGPFANARDLSSASLLHLDNLQNGRWFTWQTWLDALGVDFDNRNHGLVFNTYNMVVDAAIAHQGIALGWEGLVDSAVEKGQLVPACDVSLSSDKGYWLIFNPNISDTCRNLVWELLNLSVA